LPIWISISRLILYERDATAAHFNVRKQQTIGKAQSQHPFRFPQPTVDKVV
jgi:hypothetical protein